jgi:hypothetical protein
MKSYLEDLKSKQYIIDFMDWDEGQPLPNVLLISSPEMQAFALEFGDSVAFDITYKLCSFFVKVPLSGQPDE